MKRVCFAIAAAVLAVTVHAGWTYDATAKTLSNDDWLFASVTKGTVDGVEGLVLSGTVTGSAEVMDFTSAKTDCGYPVVKINTGFGAVAVKRLIAPDLLSINGSFNGNTTIEEITVSPDLSYMGPAKDSRYFEGCTALRSFKPSVLPKVTALGKRLFFGCSNLTVDFVFAGVTEIDDTAINVFYNSHVTSLEFPNLTKTGSNFCYGNTAITNFYAPKCTTLCGSDFAGCTALKRVVLSEGLTKLPGNVFSGCAALEEFSPLEIPGVTEVGVNAFNSCQSLRGVLSIPNAVSSGDCAFQKSGFDEIYVPSMNVFGKYAFSDSPNLAKVTLSALRTATGGMGNAPIKGVNANGNYKFELFWTGTEIPTAFTDSWLRPNGSNQGSVSDSDTRIYVKADAWQAWQDQWGSDAGFVLAKNLTDAQKASAYYPGPADTLGLFSKSSGGGWFCAWVNKVQTTIETPEGIEVLRVVQNGVEIAAEDGKYPLNPDLAADITYRTAGTRLFVDGARDYTVVAVTVDETIPASVCDKEVVEAEARIGESLYLTAQTAFDAGGEVVLLKTVVPDAALAVADGRAVTLDLNGQVIVAEGTVFDVAGELTVFGEGSVGGSAFTGSGVYKLKGGTYRFDVSAYCAGGFVATVQGTDPETWVVAQNSDVTQVSIDLTVLEAAHIGAAALTFGGDVPCVTNGNVVSWTVPKNAAFEIVYVVAEADDVNYRFADRTMSTVVSYPDGVAEATVVTDLPETVQHPKWRLTVEATVAYLEDGNWKLKVSYNRSKASAISTTTSAAGKTFTGYELMSNCRVAGSGVLDLLTCKDDTGYGVILMNSSGLGGNTATSILAPDLVALCNSAFRDATALETIEVSPEFFRIEQRVFQDATGLKAFIPSNLPDLENYGKLDEPGPFSTKSPNLKGDFVFGKVTQIPYNCFVGTGITSFEAPLATNVLTSAFDGCASLKRAVLPRARHFEQRAFAGCSAVEHIEFDAEHTDSVGISGFSGMSTVTNFPTSFGELTFAGMDAFAGCNIIGDLSIPKVEVLDETFGGCKSLTSVDASSCTNYGHYVFNNCTALTNVIVRGGHGCFTGNCPYSKKGHANCFNGCTSLKTVWWLSEEAPEILASNCFSDGPNAASDYEPPILYVNGDFDAWAALCTKAKADFTDDHKMIANYGSLKKRLIVGFMGAPSKEKGQLKVIYPATGGINWVLKNPGPPKGFSVIVR